MMRLWKVSLFLWFTESQQTANMLLKSKDPQLHWSQKLLAIDILKSFQMREVYEFFDSLAHNSQNSDMLKILAYFLTSIRRYLTTMHQEKMYILM